MISQKILKVVAAMISIMALYPGSVNADGLSAKGGGMLAKALGNSSAGKSFDSRKSNSAEASAAEVDVIRKAVTAALPNVIVGTISKLPYGGWYEVIFDKSNILYVDSSGQVGLFGNLVELNTRKNLTELRKDDLMVTDFSKLPLGDAFVRVKGNGSRKMALFSDPECPYCKRIEQELSKVTDVTIYTFLLPLDAYSGAT